MANASSYKLHVQIYDGGALGNALSREIMCKCTMVAFLKNASSREFHEQIYGGGALGKRIKS